MTWPRQEASIPSHLDASAEDEVGIARITETKDASEPVGLKVANLEEGKSWRLVERESGHEWLASQEMYDGEGDDDDATWDRTPWIGGRTERE